MPGEKDTLKTYAEMLGSGLLYGHKSGSWIYIAGGIPFGLSNTGGSYDSFKWNVSPQAAAFGSLGLDGGPTLVNELGTEDDAICLATRMEA